MQCTLSTPNSWLKHGEGVVSQWPWPEQLTTGSPVVLGVLPRDSHSQADWSSEAQNRRLVGRVCFHRVSTTEGNRTQTHWVFAIFPSQSVRVSASRQLTRSGFLQSTLKSYTHDAFRFDVIYEENEILILGFLRFQPQSITQEFPCSFAPKKTKDQENICIEHKEDFAKGVLFFLRTS